MLLRDLEFVVRALLASLAGTTDALGEPVPLTVAERKAARERAEEGKADLMTVDEALDQLGLRRPSKEVAS